MRTDIIEEPIGALAEHGRVPIAFAVRSVFEVTGPAAGAAEFALAERRLDVPWVKDYDLIDGERPARWAACFDVANWGLFGAFADGVRVGGAVVAFDTAGVAMLEGRRDLAVLWDIRVAPPARGRGAGSALFRAAEAWAAARGCRELKVETQNINVPACRCYARQGCALAEVHRLAYAGLPDEIQLIWRKKIRPAAGGAGKDTSPSA
jgi:GNAT superfamily N-acetyltransferase